MAKQASMYRLSKDKGIVVSRYCADVGKKKCKRYEVYKSNICKVQEWKEFRAGRYVLVPISEL